MIKDREIKIKKITETIKNDKTGEVNKIYGQGPGLYFYRKILKAKLIEKNIRKFINNEQSLELIYATLAIWGMNTRRARMKDFRSFAGSVHSCESELIQLADSGWDFGIKHFLQIENPLSNAYNKLDLMDSKSRLVANSKILHFLLPELLMPMDNMNTLAFLKAGENDYMEIIKMSFEIIGAHPEWREFKDDGKWYPTLSKRIDNAIVLEMRKKRFKSNSSI